MLWCGKKMKMKWKLLFSLWEVVVKLSCGRGSPVALPDCFLHRLLSALSLLAQTWSNRVANPADTFRTCDLASFGTKMSSVHFSLLFSFGVARSLKVAMYSSKVCLFAANFSSSSAAPFPLLVASKVFPGKITGFGVYIYEFQNQVGHVKFRL